ncbi:transmembrane protein 198-like [Rhopilema esculentum]|uniref:transmembrane protein 198-like n=1 Tax=Rhopilema esculentum TaxID=499914 RepID=UPI0031E17555|eukprot:gene14801-5906_t
MNASKPLITTQRPLQISSLNETMQVLNSTLAAVANFTLMPVISSGSDNASSSLAPLTSSPSTASDKCKAFAYNFHENIPISAVCGLCFIIGLILVLVGYRAFRFSMFIMGLSLASVLTYLVLINKTKLGLTWTSPIAAGAGLFLGLFAASIPVLGLIIASIIQGLFFTVIVLFIITLFFTDHVIWICVGSLGGLSIIFTIFMFLKQRQAAIVYITSYGAILIMIAADYFLDLFLIANYAYSLILQVEGRKPCWFSWTLFAMWPFLLILGCCVQIVKTARGYYHSPALQKKAQENKYKTDSTGRSRRLYDNGDVIAQAWIQTTDDTLDKRRSFTPVHEYDSADDKESTTLV